MTELESARWRRWLASMHLTLGSLARNSACRRAQYLHAQEQGHFRWLLGQAVICCECSRVVGVATDGAPQFVEFLDPSAGFVLERRYQVLPGAWTCGSHGCDPGPYWDNPIACSDECERGILASADYESCRAPRGYKRFAAGLEARP